MPDTSVIAHMHLHVVDRSRALAVMLIIALAVMLIIALALTAGSADAAPATVPTADAEGSADSPMLKRYEGSLILLREHARYDELALPLSRLEPVPDKIVGNNNRAHEPASVKRLEGAHTRLVYLLPPERSPLEVLRNYQQTITAGGGRVLFECQAEACGGDPSRSSSGGGGDTSLAMFLYPAERVRAEYHSAAWCALAEEIADLRYTAAELAGGGAHAAVQVYTLVAPDEYDACLPLNGRTIAVVDLVESQAMEQNMVTVSANDMAKAIAGSGRIALYGIQFDFDSAQLRPDSTPQLEQIAAMLKADPAMTLEVVGHTDNIGQADYNRDLSQRRAAAAVAALVGEHGIDAARLSAKGKGSDAPIASNDDEAGRSRNRRVELVKH